jgi:hypothetical protein
MLLVNIKKIAEKLPELCAQLEIPAKYIETAYFKAEPALKRIRVSVGEVHENSAHNIYFSETATFIRVEWVDWQ